MKVSATVSVSVTIQDAKFIMSIDRWEDVGLGIVYIRPEGVASHSWISQDYVVSNRTLVREKKVTAL